MKKSFKILSILLCLALFLTSFVACTKSDDDESTTKSKKQEKTTEEQTTEKSTLEVLTGDGLAKVEDIDFEVLTTIDYYATDEGMTELLVGVWKDDFEGTLYDCVDISATEYYQFTSDGYLYITYDDVYIDYDQYINYMVGVMNDELTADERAYIIDAYGSLENYADYYYWDLYESYEYGEISYVYSVVDGKLKLRAGYDYAGPYTIEFADENTVSIDGYEYTRV